MKTNSDLDTWNVVIWSSACIPYGQGLFLRLIKYRNKERDEKNIGNSRCGRRFVN